MFIPWGPFKTSAPFCSIEDTYELLVSVLHTCITLAELHYSLLEVTENSEALKSFDMGLKADDGI